VEFIEFCASEEEAPYLGELLGTLGFAPVRRHRTKAVTRWRQGQINLVVNCESEGFAHFFESIHGTSVCAIGLRVPEAAAAMRRARELSISAYRQPLGPGEFELPAVRGGGGSPLYFVQADQSAGMWESEFERLVGPGTAGDAGLLRVDHLAHAMQYDEMLSWLLFHLALFDMAKSPQVEIADPSGLVLSQAVQSPGGALRITLNGSAAAQTLASRFLHAYVGAGVQHIAFATADTFSTARAACPRHGRAADSGQLLRRPRGSLRPGRYRHRGDAVLQHPVRPQW
jgi:4-hydroxyphenylpyruvate dioxygenase